jgi:predicted DNA-binding protein
MAKKPLENPFAKTEPARQPVKGRKEDPTRAVGLALRESEWERFDAIANELGMRRGALLSEVIRRFISDYEDGRIETTTRKTLK